MIYKELKDVFIHLVFILRGYDYTDLTSAGQNLIRLAYQQNSQPFQNIEDSITYVWVNFDDAKTNKQFNETSSVNDDGNLVHTKSNLRTISVHFTTYGEGAEDVAYTLRQMMVSYAARDFLAIYDIRVIPDIPEAVLIYEEINNQWWPRVEIIVNFYMQTEFSEVVENIASVVTEVILEDGKKIDFSVLGGE